MKCNNPENSATTKIEEHIHRGYSASTIWAFDHIESKDTLPHGKACMKKFCEFLRENKKSIIDLKNVTIDKRRTKIPSRYKNLLHLWKIA